MSALVRIYCPVCDGASEDNRLPPCEYCNNNGHFSVDRDPDGTPPTQHRDGTPVRLWKDESEALFASLAQRTDAQA